MAKDVKDDEVFWAEIDEALGIAEPGTSDGGVMVQHFRDAGFTEDEACRGAALMESGRYFGFGDVATSLRPADGWLRGIPTMTPSMETAVERVAARIEEAGKSPASTLKGAGPATKKPVSEEALIEVLDRAGPGGRRVVESWLKEHK